ncbi:MAG: aminotransferase class IV family protein [Verrucomicrobiaceae bacterium]|nr:aminotransferase class IV family protein [Verrucomicrobiaceae bacterium]
MGELPPPGKFLQLVRIGLCATKDGMETEWVWLDGEVMPAVDARVRANSPGFMLGLGVFETLLWRDGGPAVLSRHWRRLSSGLSRLRLPPVPEGIMRDALAQVYAASAPARKRLRFTVYLGSAGSLHLLATCTEPTKWPEVESVMVSSWKHNEHSPLVGIKCTSYAANWMAHREAVAAGFGEALLLNTKDQVCEGTGSNLFMVTASGDLITPPLSSGCLPGVTREIVLEALPTASERSVHLHDLATCSEMFLTSSTRGVQPVGWVDGVAVPVVNGKWTQAAREGLMTLLHKP